jgi:1,2-diacylglycerol 3-alpha-glucosyltransferase
VKEIKVAPVGLDFDLMYQDYKKQDINLLKETLGLDCDSNYMLLVGRLDNDRNPLDCISVFERIHSKNQRYKLLIIGKGSLKEELFSQMKNINLHQYVDYIEQVPNDEMWKYYRVADCLISLSKTEIFGMSLLEAMYYETPVYVIHAPGPNDIIVNNVTGYLFASPEKMADAIVKEQFDRVKEPSHSRVVNEFSWKTAVEAIETLC